MDWDTLGSHHLATQMDEPRVMPNVGVGKQDAIESTRQLGIGLIQSANLTGKTRGALNKPALVCRRINNAQTRHIATFDGITPQSPAAFLFAAGLRVTTILSGPQHHRKWMVGWCGKSS
jgi:hypothetical protein